MSSEGNRQPKRSCFVICALVPSFVLLWLSILDRGKLLFLEASTIQTRPSNFTLHSDDNSLALHQDNIGSLPKSQTALLNYEEQPRQISCEWETMNDTACTDLLIRRIYRTATWNATVATPRRWLFFGDSTMYRLFLLSPIKSNLQKSLNQQCSCQTKTAQRCNKDVLFQTEQAERWRSPNFTLGEGPVAFGKENPFCQDCSGCRSYLVLCNDQCNQGGGYASVEFARDVEVQTTLYQTSQENWALQLEKDWNTVSSPPPPVCVISTGHHDVIVPRITRSVYTSNVEWYLTLMHKQCSHLVWLSNTAPKTDKFAQKKKLTRDWNLAILNEILRPKFRKDSTFVDVYKASLEYPHMDNIHMEDEWYNALGKTFVKIMDSQD